MRALLAALFVIAGAPAAAESYQSIQDRRPELFHPETGFRIDRQRSPTPDNIPPPARKISAKDAREVVADGAVVLDVFGALQSRYDELDGTWLVEEARMSLPGAVWLPEVGRGVLDSTMQSYLETELDALAKGDLEQAIVVFCVADCWMSWNAAQRIAKLGYKNVNWFRLGTDGWLDEGWELEPTYPVPVPVD